MLGTLRKWWLTKDSTATEGRREDLYEDLSHLYTDAPRAMATSYPEVPPPEDEHSPLILAARWTSHDIYGEDMPAIAADMLEAGLDTPALRRLAGEVQVHSKADVEPLVSRMFQELKVRYPLERGEAEFVAVRQIAREVIAGLRNPWAAASHIEKVICGWMPEKSYLKAICSLNDQICWDLPYRRSVRDLSKDLFDIFADVATMSDKDLDHTL